MQFHNGDWRETLMIYLEQTWWDQVFPKQGEHTEEDHGQKSRTRYA